MDIKLLDCNKYKDYYMDFSYVSNHYYDLQVNGLVGEYCPKLTKKNF